MNPARSYPDSEGRRSDLLALLPFLVLIAILYLAGREVILSGTSRVR